MRKTLSNNKTFIEPPAKVPVELIELSSNAHSFDCSTDADKFLGIAPGLISSYVQSKSKLIVSKRDGKLYVIRKAKGKQ